MESLAKILDFIKLPLIYISAFLLASSCFIFVPDNILSELGVVELKTQYRSYIGITFIFSSSIIFVNFIAYIFKKLKRKYKNYIWRRIAIKTLRSLNIVEKSILRDMIMNGTHSREIDITGGSHSRLEYHKIIYWTSNLSTIGTLFTFNIQPWVVDYLRKYPTLVID